jgi:uncharacterized protein (DUF362 family)
MARPKGNLPVKMHPLLQDPDTVLIFRTRVSEPVCWSDFQRAGTRVLAALRIEVEGERVVIKPNVTVGETGRGPDAGITTHPGFVQGMVAYLREHGSQASRITIAEDPRNTDDDAPRHWRRTGYETIAPALGVRLHSPTTYTCVKRPVQHPLVHAQLNVSRVATAPGTILINIPKLKTHNLAITTLCLKNLMGLVNARDRHYCSQAWRDMPEEVRTNPRPRHEWMDRELHERWQAGLARRLADTAQVIQPTLNVVEGIVGREGTGFERGRNRALGLAVAGTNMVAVDSVASYLVGFDPQRLVYLQVAAEAGLGVNDLRCLHVFALQDGDWRSAADIGEWRADPPFRVVSGIVGEEPGLFQ